MISQEAFLTFVHAIKIYFRKLNAIVLLIHTQRKAFVTFICINLYVFRKTLTASKTKATNSIKNIFFTTFQRISFSFQQQYSYSSVKQYIRKLIHPCSTLAKKQQSYVLVILFGLLNSSPGIIV